MKDRLQKAFGRSINVYDDLLTGTKWWSKFYINIFWQGLDDKYVAERVLSNIPENFNGKLLDVPVGTTVFTHELYKKLTKAHIVGVDYSEDMLAIAKERLKGCKNVKLKQGDVGDLKFKDKEFDIVLSMNGFHVFPDKDKAWSETHRVLKKGGKLIACFYIEGGHKTTKRLVKNILVKKGWFTPPFDTYESLKKRLSKMYKIYALTTFIIFNLIKFVGLAHNHYKLHILTIFSELRLF